MINKPIGGLKMERREMEENTGGFKFLLAGLAIGVIAGLLYAPKPGNETREDLSDFNRRYREKVRGFVSRINGRIPGKVKAAAGYGAIKEGGAEAINEAKEKVSEAFS